MLVRSNLKFGADSTDLLYFYLTKKNQKPFHKYLALRYDSLLRPCQWKGSTRPRLRVSSVFLIFYAQNFRRNFRIQPTRQKKKNSLRPIIELLPVVGNLSGNRTRVSAHGTPPTPPATVFSSHLHPTWSSSFCGWNNRSSPSGRRVPSRTRVTRLT